MMVRNEASFRDPAGSVYDDGTHIYRTINKKYEENWEHVTQSGLLEKAISKGYLIPCKEVSIPNALKRVGIYKTIEVKRIPFISYPYEWSFSQLKDAALLTLSIQRLALEYGCILKDASGYNIQFFEGKPVFIDTLSFEKWDGHRPWEAYRQFCSHFLAPLALQSYVDGRCAALLKNWIDGIPLDVACAMLPFSARFSLGLTLHLFMHSNMQLRHADARESAAKVSKVALSPKKMRDLVDSLETTISSLKAARKATEWGGYYADTNYTQKSMQAKNTLVKEIIEKHKEDFSKEGLCVDLGANEGNFTRLASPYFSSVLAADIDPVSVENHYHILRKQGETSILPLVIDFAAPSPGLGWRCKERESFMQRVNAELILALALCHHLYFTAGIPFDEIGKFFGELTVPGGILIVEFVPFEDSQVQRLLAARTVRQDTYTLDAFCNALETNGFTLLKANPIPDSGRTLLELRKDGPAKISGG